MTVKELIEALQKQNPEAQVFMWDEHSWYNLTIVVEPNDTHGGLNIFDLPKQSVLLDHDYED